MRLHQTLFLFVAAVLLPAAPMAAQNDREFRAALERLERMTAEAQELIEHGKLEAATKLLAEASELKAGLEARRRERGAHSTREALEHLEAAAGALRRGGRGDAADRVLALAREIARGVEKPRRREREARNEREQLEHELRMFRHAKGAFRELEKNDLVEIVERSMHARELRLAGRRDDEARRIIHAQPKWGQEVELLTYASRVLKEFKAHEKAIAVGRLAETMKARHQPERKSTKRKPTEREVAAQQIETFQYCVKVLAKAGRKDAAESLERAVHAMRLRLAGKRGEEAQAVYRRAPSRHANAEHLAMAAEILADQGEKEHAAFVAKMAKAFGNRRGREREEKREHGREEQRERKREHETRREHREKGRGQGRELEKKIHELETALVEMRRARSAGRGH